MDTAIRSSVTGSTWLAVLLVIRGCVAAEIVAVYVCTVMAVQCTVKMGQTYIIGTVTVQKDTQTYRNRPCLECRLGLPTNLYGGEPPITV